MLPDITINIVLSCLCGFSGFCLFLVWPLRVRWLLRRYAHYLYHRWSFYSQCFLSLWPLAQSILFLFYKQNAIRITIIECMLSIFVIQILLLAYDMFAVNKMSFYTEASSEEVNITRHIYPIFRFFLVLVPTINVFFIIQFLGWPLPLWPDVRLRFFLLLFLSGSVLNMLALLFENRLLQRVRKRLKLASI